MSTSTVGTARRSLGIGMKACPAAERIFALLFVFAAHGDR
jgi:hypothetical protein